MAATTAACDLGLQTMWQGQSTLVQVQAFSVLLVTVAITMQHVPILKLSKAWVRGRFFMAACLAVVAVAFGVLAVVAYSRTARPQAGCAHEVGVHRAYLACSLFLVAIELFFAVYTFCFAAMRQAEARD